MKLILDNHKKDLEKMIGQTIDYCLIPDLQISVSEVYPDTSQYGKDYGAFYSSSLVNLRLINSSGDKSWIKICPGPDEDIEPWAPLFAQELKQPDFDDNKKETELFEKEYESKLKDSKKDKFELENEFLDGYADGLGMNRCNLWKFEDPIKSIEVHEFNPYAACIIEHSSGMTWSIYAEYDFVFWLNSSEKMAKSIRENSESFISIN